VIKPLLSFGQEIGYLRINLGTAFKAPPVKKTLAECILANTLLMIRLEPNARNRALLMLLYGAGLRISEVTGLRWRDLVEHAGAGQVTVYGKGSKTRVVFLSDNTWTTLGEIGRSTAPMTRIRSDDPDNDEYNPDEAGQRKDHCTLPFEHGVLAVSHLSGHLGRDRGTTALDAPVFRFCKSRPLDLSQAHRIVKAAAARAGLSAEVSAHWLRHAHASHSLDRGAPIRLVKQNPRPHLGGHHGALSRRSAHLWTRPGRRGP